MGTFIKPKIGFLTRNEDGEAVWPRTADECLQHDMLVLAPSFQYTADNRRKSKVESLQVKQGDLVALEDNDLFIFLGAAKVFALPAYCCYRLCAV